MKLKTKINLFFLVLASVTLSLLLVVALFAFRHFSIDSAETHVRTSAEIVRVSLTESMINGVIHKREEFLTRLAEVPGLQTARVVRGPLVVRQFGAGLAREQPADEIERRVLREGRPFYEVNENGPDVIFRGTIPFVATNKGTPNCLQCHDVPDGSVLGAVTLTLAITTLKTRAIWTVGFLVGVMTIAILMALLFLRRLLHPLTTTANAVEDAVQRAIQGDFQTHIERQTNDEIGQIAEDLNRLLEYLRSGLSTIGNNIAQLINYAPRADYNLLTTTVDMVDGLVKASQFKQAIEEDETKQEIYLRLSGLLRENFGINTFSIYEVLTNNSQMGVGIVDGQVEGDCKWCEPEILLRAEACRVRRTGHAVDSLETPGICYAFKSPADGPRMCHVCIPVMQSGAVGSVVQLVAPCDEKERLHAVVPFVNIYLKETAPVLESKRLMATLRESNLRDAMTGLHNRRFLEEYAQTLVAANQRRNTHLSLLMLDLDYFKMVNDKHGHDAGDAVLKALARVLTQSVRASDLVIRYGGEEFLIILQDTSAEGAEVVAEKIRAAVEELQVSISGTVLQKTISIGISDFPTDSETFWQAIKYADVALYKAKEQGRNQVVRFVEAMWPGHQNY